MGLRVHSTMASAGLLAMIALIDNGAGTSLVQIYSGAKPTNLGDAVTTQLKLAEFDLPDPVFPPADIAPTTGGMTATADVDNIPTATAESAAGTGTVAAWFQVIDGNGLVVMDGEVTDTNGVGPMKLANTTIVANIDVTIVSWTAFHPDGTV